MSHVTVGRVSGTVPANAKRRWSSHWWTLAGVALVVGWYYRGELWGWWVTSKAFVNCTVGVETIACSVEQRGGTVPAHVCWDLVVVCSNGNRSTASACLDVPSNQTATREISRADFIPTMDRCDAVQSVSAANLVTSQIR